ncbi:hypothetical protein DFH08DRAFT_1081110 [Mycena albidolilacea]|uniref:Glucose-methanol-choline oxidoreductase N-terminal domain-containing protein n=1 Tax=Mycena albidolilacea TaxID=1033008 RepID=A0AAD6ZYX0_9AGAR|nr:hypothetical protein DFH08DRAFT_1081110 [Mycena albidolilacea]
MRASTRLACVLVGVCTARVQAFDYVIVGGGTAGLVVANRLTKDPLVSVMVLEAGGDGLGNTNISDVTLIGAAWGTQVDWQFPTEPLLHDGNRSSGTAPRGKVLGGSSAINGDVFDYGDAREYDEWLTLGNTGWNAQSIIAAGKKAEHFYAPKPSDDIDFTLTAHGLSGNIATSYNSAAPPIHDDVISSVVNAGGLRSADNAGGNVDGISHATNARLPLNSTRATAATGYYFPYSYRKNFQVTLNVVATKILWSSIASGSAVASGVEYVDEYGATHTISAKTVVLSAGAWGSPPILERSGVGNATFLKSLGIKSVVDLPGVGENLQEQTIAPMLWSLNASLPLNVITPFLLNMESLQKTLGSGNLATLESLLNVQPPSLSDALYNAHKSLYSKSVPWIEGYVSVSTPASGPSVLAWYPVNLHPLSRGSVHIVSTNGTAYPKIQYNFFDSPFDTYVLAAAVQRVQSIVSTPPLSGWIASPISPPAGVTSIQDLKAFVLENVATASHIMGTALMAPLKDGGVVDANLKVYGTKNVYVIDASVVPIEPAAHLQATVYALAGRAAELLS